jgi:hypothetical protein
MLGTAQGLKFFKKHDVSGVKRIRYPVVDLNQVPSEGQSR